MTQSTEEWMRLHLVNMVVVRVLAGDLVLQVTYLLDLVEKGIFKWLSALHGPENFAQFGLELF